MRPWNSTRALPRFLRAKWLVPDGRDAEAIERLRQIFRDSNRITSFDLVPFQHEHDLAVLEDSN